MANFTGFSELSDSVKLKQITYSQMLSTDHGDGGWHQIQEQPNNQRPHYND